MGPAVLGRAAGQRGAQRGEGVVGAGAASGEGGAEQVELLLQAADAEAER